MRRQSDKLEQLVGDEIKRKGLLASNGITILQPWQAKLWRKWENLLLVLEPLRLHPQVATSLQRFHGFLIKIRSYYFLIGYLASW